MATPTFNKDGAKATTAAKLDAKVFGVLPQNHDLLKQVYTAYLSNGRTRNAVTLKRGEVSGGGKKPWKQKGTGRARFGSTRNPIWRGGGIAFGPTGEENYYKQVNVKAKRTALKQALSLAAQEDRIIVLESFDTQGKTAATVKLLNAVGATGSILLVVSLKDELVLRATTNLQKVHAVQANFLNTYDVMNSDSIVISQKSLEVLNDWLATEAKAEVTA